MPVARMPRGSSSGMATIEAVALRGRERCQQGRHREQHAGRRLLDQGHEGRHRDERRSHPRPDHDGLAAEPVAQPATQQAKAPVTTPTTTVAPIATVGGIFKVVMA